MDNKTSKEPIHHSKKDTANKSVNHVLPVKPGKLDANGKELILEKLIQQIPAFQIRGKATPLSGGLLNYVWRLEGSATSTPTSLIAKWAPPYIASSPNVQLDPERIYIEAGVMAAFNPGGVLSSLATELVRPPHLFLLDRSAHMLIMEDVCNCPDLGLWITEPRTRVEATQLGKALGEFLGNLHRFSAHHPELAQEFDNPKIQHTRLEILYKNIPIYAQRAHLPEALEMGKNAIAYGELLQQPGKTLIMGDLWLPSIIVSGNNLRIIDWELAHYGRPSQDVGHLTSHLWMNIHQAKSVFAADNSRFILHGFLNAYRVALGDDFDHVFGKEGVRESSIHFGCEIMARTVGLFQNGYVYQGLDWAHPLIQEAVSIAAKHILTPFKMNTFDDLGWRAGKEKEIN